jgi:hypothetical protein
LCAGGAELLEAVVPTDVLAFKKNEKYTLWLKLSKKTHDQLDQAGRKT